jgi:Antitoxin-like ribbon-helix-helix
MPKKPNLEAIVEAAGSIRRQPAPDPLQAQPAPIAPLAKPRTRRATRQVAAHFPEEVAWQLRELAVERRSTVQALMGEALNDLFQKYGKPEIAPTDPGRAPS